MKSKTVISYMEHFDQNESNGNAATKYIVEFNNKVNCEWLWKAIADALEKHQNDSSKICQICNEDLNMFGGCKCNGYTHG